MSYDNVPDEKRKQIERAAMELYLKMMNEEAAKTDEQKKAEALQAEAAQLSAQYEQLSKSGDFQTNYPQMQSAVKRIEEIHALLGRIAPAETPSSPQIFITSHGIEGLTGE